MITAIVLSAGGVVDVRLKRPFFLAAQAVIGCIIAQAIDPQILGSLAGHGAAMLAVVAANVVGAAAAGLVLARFGSLPPSTVAWGSAPGAASAMTAMSEEYGADARLVAFMQYVRVIIIVLTASIVARLLGGPHHAPAAGTVLAPAFEAWPFAQTLGIAVIGAIGGRFLRIPNGALLGPLVLGGALHATGVVHIELPPALLDATYAVVGAYVGLGFTRETVRYAFRALPEIVVTNVLLIAFSAGAAALLVITTGVDRLSAYLATSPGGLDSIAIIALGSGVNVPLVIALQTLRLVAVLTTGPFIAKFIIRFSGRSG